jgi:hypothetical protein
MIRIHIRTDDRAAAGHIGGAVDTLKSFDVDLPEVEAYIRANSGKWCFCQVYGAELIPQEVPGV